MRHWPVKDMSRATICMMKRIVEVSDRVVKILL
jgi:hypothetical protein